MVSSHLDAELYPISSSQTGGDLGTEFRLVTADYGKQTFRREYPF